MNLLLTDVDGTLLGKDNVIPADTLEALRAVRANGNRIVFFTGRPYSHVPEAVRALDFDGCLCVMGAYVRIGDEVALDQKPAPEQTAPIIRLVRQCCLDAAFEASDGISFDAARPISPFLCKLRDSFAARGFNVTKDIDAPDFTFDKLCVWENDRSDLARFARESAPYMDMIGRKQNMAELVAKGVSVEASVGMVMQRLGADKAHTFAIGDSVNDLPFLRCAAQTAAMGEATDEMKRQVTFATAGLAHGGFASAMRRFGLM